eukprot:scaffold14733_cov20-Tisochrysis_lutea.AAC.1
MESAQQHQQAAKHALCKPQAGMFSSMETRTAIKCVQSSLDCSMPRRVGQEASPGHPSCLSPSLCLQQLHKMERKDTAHEANLSYKLPSSGRAVNTHSHLYPQVDTHLPGAWAPELRARGCCLLRSSHPQSPPKVAAVLQPWAGHRNVVSRALALG